MPSWINREKNRNSSHSLCSTRIVDTSTFCEIQQAAYDIVFNYFSNVEQNPLRLLIMDVAGTGKSYVIDSLRNLLQTKSRVLAYTGKASFNVNEVTLHPLLTLPLGTKRN